MKKKGKPFDFTAAAAGLSDVAGLFITDLAEGDVVDVETQNHVYTLLVIDPARGLVEAMSNGPHLRDPLELVVVGSQIGETSIRLRWISVGFCLELGHLTLSSTKTVTVNGVRVLPPGQLQ